MDNTKLKDRMGGKIQELQQQSLETVATNSTKDSAESVYLALTNNSLNIIRANLKHHALSLDLFDTVKSPSGGSTVFSVPGLSWR